MSKKKKNEEPSSFFKYTPLFILLSGFAIVAGAVSLSRDDVRKNVAIVYPAPIEAPVAEKTTEIVNTPEPTPEVRIDVVPPEAESVEVPAEVPPVIEKETTKTEPGIEWPIVKDEPPAVVKEESKAPIAVPSPIEDIPPLPVKKPNIEKKKKKICKKVAVEETAKDVFDRNFMRGNGF